MRLNRKGSDVRGPLREEPKCDGSWREELEGAGEGSLNKQAARERPYQLPQPKNLQFSASNNSRKGSVKNEEVGMDGK